VLFSAYSSIIAGLAGEINRMVPVFLLHGAAGQWAGGRRQRNQVGQSVVGRLAVGLQFRSMMNDWYCLECLQFGISGLRLG